MWEREKECLLVLVSVVRKWHVLVSLDTRDRFHLLTGWHTRHKVSLMFRGRYIPLGLVFSHAMQMICYATSLRPVLLLAIVYSTLKTSR
jgi:hypothetical protein